MVRLPRENRELKRERDLLEQATAYFAKANRLNPRSSPRSEVTSPSPVDVVASRFSHRVSTDGLRPASPPGTGGDRQLGVHIRARHVRSRGTYGSPRVHRELATGGVRVGTKRVARIMREHGLSGLRPPRFRKTTDSDHGDAIADDLVKRDFAPAAPNTVWASDITYVRTWAGWLYLAMAIDLYSRRVVR